MSDKQKNSQKFPEKPITLQDGATVEFKKINEDFPSALVYYPQRGGYQELYPSVYSIDVPGEGFVKLWNHFATEYLEDRGLINYDQFSLRNYISSLRNRGYYITVKSRKEDGDIKGLAQFLKMRTATLTAHLDHLEDCLLIHRVRRLDLHGTPNEFVAHTEFTAKQLDAGKEKIIVDRVARQHTKTKREKAVRRGGEESGKFGYLDRKATDERFQFDYRMIKSAFGDNSLAFADFALEFFKAHLGMLRNKKSEFDYAYRSELNRRMSAWGIGGNSAREQCYIAANKFRVIYCPTDEELFA